MVSGCRSGVSFARSPGYHRSPNNTTPRPPGTIVQGRGRETEKKSSESVDLEAAWRKKCGQQQKKPKNARKQT